MTTTIIVFGLFRLAVCAAIRSVLEQTNRNGDEVIILWKMTSIILDKMNLGLIESQFREHQKSAKGHIAGM